MPARIAPMCLAALGIFAFTTTLLAQSLQPSRALYNFEPSRLSQNGEAMPLEGRIAYELTGNDCKGYQVDSRIANIYAGQDGQRRVDLASATFEAGDGKSFDAKQTRYVNAQAGDEEHIAVQRADNGSGKGTIRGPRKVDFDVKPEVLFPSAFEKKLLAAAMRGEKRDESLLFDGSDGEKTFRAFTTIGPLRPPGSVVADKNNPAAAPLMALRSWSFAISYFPASDDKAETADYQSDFIMYENGVTTSMTIDYGTYALKGTLAQLQMLPDEPCTPDAAPAANAPATPQ